MVQLVQIHDGCDKTVVVLQQVITFELTTFQTQALHTAEGAWSDNRHGVLTSFPTAILSAAYLYNPF